MSISEIVDAEYRLHAADLAGRPQSMVIANVSYQGVEQLAPVLHFEGTTKRLVLTPDLVHRLVKLSGTPIFANWIGITVVLEASRVDGLDVIGIASVHDSPYARHAVSDERDLSEVTRVAVVTIGAVGLVGLLYGLSTLPAVRALLSSGP